MRKGKAGAESEQQQDLAGLGSDIEMPKLTPALQPADLEDGVIARYVGSEQRHSKGFDRPQQMHTFQLGQAFDSVRFALWGAVQLDMKLRAVQRGSIVFVQYMGRDSNREKAPHQWAVRPFHGTTQDLAALADRYRDACEKVAMAVGALEARASGADFADEGIPF
jgi:hypothetical protein